MPSSPSSRRRRRWCGSPATTAPMGVGYTYTIGTGGSSVVALLRDHLAPRLIGRDAGADRGDLEGPLLRDARHRRSARSRAWRSRRSTRALWDLRCRRAGEPLWKMAGGAQPKVPVYTTEGGWLHHPQQQLVDEARGREGAGFQRAARSRSASRRLPRTSRGLSAVRAAVGDAFEVMVDANQAFTVAEAVPPRARLRAARCSAWFEEPLPAEDLGGHVELAAKATHADRRRRIARITRRISASISSAARARWSRSIAPASAASRRGSRWPISRRPSTSPVCPHFLMELHVSLSAAVPNGAWVEYIPQLDAITTSRMAMQRRLRARRRRRAGPRHRLGLRGHRPARRRARATHAVPGDTSC